MTTRWFGSAAFLVLAACGSDVDLAGDGAFIIGNVSLGADCTTTADAPLLQTGEYDIAEAGTSNGNPDSHPCQVSYVMRLVAEIDANQIAVFDQATVTLRTLNDEKLYFEALPNPFRLAIAGSVRPKGATPKRGVVEIGAIPDAYASSLRDFVDSQVRVEVQLEGYLDDGSAVRTQVFGYPVNICEGCLTLCRAADILLGMDGVLPADLTEGQCSAPTAAGMDGRICIDPDC